jgi:hypothetical protein
MKITDVIRTVLDLVDAAEAAEPQVSVTIEPPQQPDPAVDDAALVRMRQIAGLLDDEDGEFQNSPTERYATIDDMMSHGDDVHKPKNPADIRTNAPSMYPGHQHDPNK